MARVIRHSRSPHIYLSTLTRTPPTRTTCRLPLGNRVNGRNRLWVFHKLDGRAALPPTLLETFSSQLFAAVSELCALSIFCRYRTGDVHLRNELSSPAGLPRLSWVPEALRLEVPVLVRGISEHPQGRECRTCPAAGATTQVRSCRHAADGWHVDHPIPLALRSSKRYDAPPPDQ